MRRVFFADLVRNKPLLTIAGTGLQVLHGLTERVAVPIETPAVVNAHSVVVGVFGRRTVTAVA